MFPDTWIIKRSIPMPTTESVWGWNKRPTITIYPIGDLHLGSIGCHEKEWEQFVSFLQNEPDAYIVVVGDMLNNSTRNSIGNPFDERWRPMEAKNMLADFLKPIADKVLCGVRGNHENRSVKEVDQDPLYDVFCRLNIEERYRAGTAFLYVTIGSRDTLNNGKPSTRPMQTYNIVVTHGTGGGKLAGSAINNQHRFGASIEGMDCLITGHTHAPSITKPSKTVFDPKVNEIRTEPFACVQCASWLAYSGYPLAKMLPPQSSWSNNVPQKIELCAQRDVKLIRATM